MLSLTFYLFAAYTVIFLVLFNSFRVIAFLILPRDSGNYLVSISDDVLFLPFPINVPFLSHTLKNSPSLASFDFFHFPFLWELFAIVPSISHFIEFPILPGTFLLKDLKPSAPTYLFLEFIKPSSSEVQYADLIHPNSSSSGYHQLSSRIILLISPQMLLTFNSSPILSCLLGVGDSLFLPSPFLPMKLSTKRDKNFLDCWLLTE